MSAIGLQRAIALLIRLPETNRGQELDGFLDRFELTPAERAQASKLAATYDVAKFGRIMGGVREGKVMRLLKHSRAYIPDETIREIWERHFEPKATSVRYNELPTAFLEFLVSDPAAKTLLLGSAAPFVFDLLRFELAQGKFQMKHFRSIRPVLPGSCLAHSDFVTLSLDYDIQAFRARLIREKPEPGSLSAERRDVRLLFLRKIGTYDCRIFETDGETNAFLESELVSPSKSTPRPKTYSSLVELGVCHA